jgi:hypothetical protein
MTDTNRNDRDQRETDRSTGPNRGTGGYGNDTGFSEGTHASDDERELRARDPGASGSGQARGGAGTPPRPAPERADTESAISETNARGEVGGWSEERREGMERLSDDSVDERTGRTRSEHDSSRVEHSRERDIGRDPH